VTQYILSDDADRDLNGIWDYIAEDNIDAADHWISRLFDAFDAIGNTPGIGHKWRSDWSILAWQVDDVVGEVQSDSIQREVSVLDFLGEHDVAVAIVACKRSGSVGMYGEIPDLKFLGGNSLVVGLNDHDFVQKPIRSTVLGDVLRAVGVENVSVDPVPIPVFAAGELREVTFAESVHRHVAPLSFEVTPTAGTREAALKAQRHRQTWNK
jgi:hypothetical protein